MKIIHFGVMVMVSLVMIAGLMIPITSEFADEIHSVDFNTAMRYSLAETDDKLELEIINGIGYLNGDTIKDEYGYRMMMFSDSFVVIYDVSQEPNITAFTLLSVTGSTGASNGIKSIVAEKGAWVATKTDNTQVTGEYEWIMAWNKNGDYGAAIPGQIAQPLFVNADSVIYTCGAGSATSISLKKGTVNNLVNVINVGEAPEQTITTEQYTTEPNVIKITEFTSSITPSSIFVPLKYDVITSMDTMTKTIVSLSPLLIGIFLFAAMGISLMRLGKLE